MTAASPPSLTSGEIEELDHIAALCDIALQDAVTERSDETGERYSIYDGRSFAKALASNGYKVVPLSPLPSTAGWLPISTAPKEPARILAYKSHAELPGKWRARKMRYNAFALEVELPCINGLAAWFTVATFHEAGDDERLMTDGARQEAGEYAEKFAALVRNSMQTSDAPSQEGASEVEGQT